MIHLVADRTPQLCTTCSAYQGQGPAQRKDHQKDRATSPLPHMSLTCAQVRACLLRRLPQPRMPHAGGAHSLACLLACLLAYMVPLAPTGPRRFSGEAACLPSATARRSHYRTGCLALRPRVRVCVCPCVCVCAARPVAIWLCVSEGAAAHPIPRAVRAGGCIVVLRGRARHDAHGVPLRRWRVGSRHAGAVYAADVDGAISARR